MGMFDSSLPQASPDTSFNYGTAAEKLKRQRIIAERLMAAQQPGNQTVNGAYGGLVVKNNPLSNLAPMIQQLVGAYLTGKSDDDQKDLDKQSLDQFSTQYASLNDKARDPTQIANEAAAEMLREGRRLPMDSGVSAGETINSVPAEEVAQSFPVAPQPPDNSVPLPVTSITPKAKQSLPTKKAGAALLAVRPKPQVGAAPGDQPPIYDPMTGLLIAGEEPKAVVPSSVGPKVADIGGALSRVPVGATQKGGASGSWGPPIAPMSASQAVPPQGGTPPVAPTGTPQQAVPPMVAPVPVPSPVASDPGMTAVNGQAVPNPFVNAPQSAPGIATLPTGQEVQVSDSDPYSKAPTQQQMVSRLIALGRTGPEGQQIAQAQLNRLFASKNGRFSTTIHADPVNGGFLQATTDSQTGRVETKPLSAAGGAQKVLETKVGANGNMIERTANGWRDATTLDGRPVMTNEGQAQQSKEIDAKTAEVGKLSDMRVQRDQMVKAIPLIQKVGTGRLQTPWNNLTAYFTNSDDKDAVDRVFNTQQLAGAVEWLKGQGSVTDAERRLLASSQFNPKGSTASNVEYANSVLEMLNRHISLAEQNIGTKYGNGEASQSAPSGMMYSWQKK